MARTAPWMVGVKEREKERAREERERTVYGVFQHSSGKDGGYVVRTGEKRADGSYYFPQPYQDARPIAVGKSKAAAQKKADKMNGYS